MNRLEISFAAGTNHRLDPVLNGAIEPDGVRLITSRVHASELFWRQLSRAEFDVSEMSLSSLFIGWSHGDRTWVALPVFPRREFFHTRVVVRTNTDIRRPEDLKGARVGVPEYQQSAAVWIRGVLQDEFGVRPSDMKWFMERQPSMSHGGATDFSPPPGVELQYIPPPDSMRSMIARDELEAVLLYITASTMVDRSIGDARGDEATRPLFPDPVTEMARFFSKTGICPVNHCIVVRRELAEAHPWLALNLFHAFDEARRRGQSMFEEYARLSLQLGTISSSEGRLPPDPFPYGLTKNRAAVETLVRYQLEQGLIEDGIAIDEVFAESCRGL